MTIAELNRIKRFKDKTTKKVIQHIGTAQAMPADIRINLYPMIGDFNDVSYPDRNYKGPPIETIEVVNQTPKMTRKRRTK